MVPLKKDGNLDINVINNLPIVDFIKVIESLSDSKTRFYESNNVINESSNHGKGMKVNYTLDDEIKRGTAVDASEFLDKIKKHAFLINHKIAWD